MNLRAERQKDHTLAENLTKPEAFTPSRFFGSSSFPALLFCEVGEGSHEIRNVVVFGPQPSVADGWLWTRERRKFNADSSNYHGSYGVAGNGDARVWGNPAVHRDGERHRRL
jgi:hypothetical protein